MRYLQFRFNGLFEDLAGDAPGGRTSISKPRTPIGSSFRMRVYPGTRAAVSVKKRLPVLDGVRALAVLMVICFHFWQLFSDGSSTSLAQKLAAWGQTGVDLFFVLSGFLITGILLDSKGSRDFLRTFYVRRVLRIFPLYYAILFALYLLCPLLHLKRWTPWEQSMWFWVYLQNIPQTFAQALISGPIHFWSLAVEEHYYLFWPLLVMLLTRRRLLQVTGLAIAVSLLARVVFVGYETFYFTFARLDGLAIGSALAIFARSRPGGLARFAGWAKRLLYLGGPLLIVTLLGASGKGLLVMGIVKSTLVAVIYASVMTLAIENRLGRTAARLLSGRIPGSIGQYSYGMYVLHPFILSALHKAGLSYNLLGLFLSILLTYLAAWISWTVLEKRFLQLKRYFEYASNRQTVSPLVAV
jgi:peptidoglycan/LPS O-acetylase OafA/YrhL